jgi:hypothetical protein
MAAVSVPYDSDSGGCAILLFPPREQPPTRQPRQSDEDYQKDLDQYNLALSLNELTGDFYYTHMAVDCGEVRDTTPDPRITKPGCDTLAGTRFTVDSEPRCGVRRVDLATWKSRPHARIAVRHLEPLGVECSEFCQHVNQLIGRPFGGMKLQSPSTANPDDIICADVITRSLERSLQNRFRFFLEALAEHEYPVPPPLTYVLSDGSALISPNGYARAFGLPEGRKLRGCVEFVPDLGALLEFQLPT